MMCSCNLEPATPVSRPQKFDQKKYEQTLKAERDSLASNPRVSSDTIKPLPDSTQVSTKSMKFTETTDTIHLKIAYGKAQIDTVKLPRQKLVFVLNSDTAKKIQLKITPQDTLANLRISQIFDPKGNSDGPFGREIVFPVTEKGEHAIIVSESQMQGDPWGGRFSVEAKLLW